MFAKGLFLFLFGVGVFVLMQVVLPMVSFQVWQTLYFQQDQLLADPNPTNLTQGSIGVGGSAVLGISIENKDNFPAFVTRNYYGNNIPYATFKISVPKIKLEPTQVNVNSNEFDQNLAHLPGTALPGERGNVFVTGHSSLSTIFDGDKKAFFANLSKIKKGDEIKLSVLGQEYVYSVMGMKIVEPEDVSVILPPDQEGRYLTLMTCVPPGFNTKRLIVLAKLK